MLKKGLEFEKGMMGNTHNSVLGSHATTGGVSGIVGKLLIIDPRNGDQNFDS